MPNCLDCGTLFEAVFKRGAYSTRCPRCSDKNQKRPTYVKHRNLIYSQKVVIENLPGDWETFRANPKDLPCWRMIVKGSQWGVDWNGRIDIYCQDTIPPKIGNTVLFEEIEAIHTVKAQYVQQESVHGTVTKRIVGHASDEEADNWEYDCHNYLRMSVIPPEAEELPRITWTTAYSKTTLKGLGNQFKYKIVGAPLWERRINGGVRSQRASTEGVLAIVDQGHPMEIKDVFHPEPRKTESHKTEPRKVRVQKAASDVVKSDVVKSDVDNVDNNVDDEDYIDYEDYEDD